MIISHMYKYIFIEIPETASWAIRNELCQYYNREPILHKHAAYIEYYRIAPRDQLNYFVFAAVRNPLDCLVSRYEKYKHPKGAGSTDELIDNLTADYADFERHRDVIDSNLSFVQFFKKYYRRPIGEMIDFSSKRLDYVIRYESLQDDFLKTLRLLRIEPIRKIPVINKTTGKNKSFLDYYTPEIIDQAKRVCGPFMKRWGYKFPKDWGEYDHTWYDVIQYEMLNVLKYLYMTNIRYNNAPYSKIIRKLRAHLLK